ncbi:hypothetical protein GGR51DRAFT_540511 [Nemania sp. FL0031]|nr:hypothetical protein GGR51DRAFT_540511 [Nemania sp. FL0031]
MPPRLLGVATLPFFSLFFSLFFSPFFSFPDIFNFLFLCFKIKFLSFSFLIFPTLKEFKFIHAKIITPITYRKDYRISDDYAVTNATILLPY